MFFQAVNAVSVVAVILGIKHSDDIDYWDYTSGVVTERSKFKNLR